MLSYISQYTVLPQHLCAWACICVCVCARARAEAALQTITSIRQAQVLSSFSQITAVFLIFRNWRRQWNEQSVI